MKECEGCGSEQENSICESCKIMIPEFSRSIGIRIENGPVVEDLRQLLGNPEPTTSKIWRRMIRASASGIHDNREIWWAWSETMELDDRQWICAPPPEWVPTDSQMEIFETNSIENANTADLRRAARGGILPDGSYLCWNEGHFFLDGERIDLPYRGLASILSKKGGSKNYDWKRLLRSIHIALRKTAPRNNGHFIPGENPLANHEGRRASIMTHPTFELLNPNPPSWPHRNRRKTSSLREYFEEATWMRRWEVEVADDISRPGFQDTCSRVPTSLFLRGGRLQLRVLRPSGWRKILIPDDPDLWARLVTWALSPPNHGSYRSLLALQQYIFTDNPDSLIGEEDARGLQFLKQIVDGHENASAHPELSSFRVKGTSGLEYFVTPGRGPHGSRFIVAPVDKIDPREVNPRIRHRIIEENRALCIVETPEMRSLVIGDAIGGIILALLDDLGSRENIDTIDRHLNRFHVDDDRPGRYEVRHPEFRRILRLADDRRHLRERLENNDVAELIRRCTQSFPRLWSALLRMPLGERMTFTAMRTGGEPNITFDDCDTSFATRSIGDRNVVYMMLEASGWQRDIHEERTRGQVRNYIRIGLGSRELQNDVMEFCGILDERLLIGQNEEEPIRLQQDIQRFFEMVNPGIADLLPETDCHIR